MNTQNFKNNQARFPLSTDTLNFMQEQILLVAQLAEGLFGNNKKAILRKPTSTQDGLCIINGEVLPLKGTETGATGVNITFTSEDITAQGLTFEAARVSRYAVYTTSSTPTHRLTDFLYEANAFSLCQRIIYNSQEIESIYQEIGTAKKNINNLETNLTSVSQKTSSAEENISTLQDDVLILDNHKLPAGTVIDYYSTDQITHLNCPYGFVPTGTVSAAGSLDLRGIQTLWMPKGVIVRTAEISTIYNDPTLGPITLYKITGCNTFIAIPNDITSRGTNLHPLFKAI